MDGYASEYGGGGFAAADAFTMKGVGDVGTGA